jgi:hypothetical protein
VTVTAPGGIFAYKNPKLYIFCRALKWKMLLFINHLEQFSAILVYFMAIWFSAWSFGLFLPFWYVVPRKIWQPFF